jgi:hypothetical protein
VSCKNGQKNESDIDDDKYELSILKYDANHDALVEQKEGTPEAKEEEEDPKPPSQLASKEGKNLENEDEESFRSCNRITMYSWH